MSIEINYMTFKVLFPELDVEENLYSILEEFAKKEVSDKIWGKFYEEGVLTLIAHLFQSRKNNNDNSGNPTYPISSTSVGNVSVGYSIPVTESGNEFYNSTAYGKRFLHLRGLTKVYIAVV